MREVEGDLITLAKKGQFDIIIHGLNCFNTQKSGIAEQMVKEFNSDLFPLEDYQYQGDINKIGQIDIKKIYFHYNPEIGASFKEIEEEDIAARFYLINCYTQYRYGRDKVHLDYDALTLCFRKINSKFPFYNLGMPKIGCGLAGGDWNKVKAIAEKELKNMKVTVVDFKK